jgi:hypothetical protein
MILDWFGVSNRGITGLSTAIDGLQVRTIESFLREKNLCVVAGNLDIGLLKHYVRQGIPAICLVHNHYVVVKGFLPRKVVYNCPLQGEIRESLTKFRKNWVKLADDQTLVNWGVVAYGISD